MSNLTTIPAIDGFETTLAQSWNGAVGTVYVDSIPASTFPSGEKTYIVVNPGKTNMQVARVSAWTTGQFTVDSVSVMKGSTSLAYSQQSHAVKSKVIISDNYQFWLDIQTSINSKLDSNGGNPSSTFDLDLTGSAFRIRKDGSDMKFTDDNTPEVTLTTLASGGGADQKVAVTVSDTTTGTLDAKLTAGDGLKKTVITPGGAETLDLDVDLADTTVFVATSSGAGDSGKLALLNASGQFPTGFINNIYSKFGGNSADGVQGDANLTITGSNNTYITKNFSSWTAGSTTRTCTVTPTGCVVHIKIRGNANFTNWTFSFAGKGAPGGAGGGQNVAGTAGTSTTQLLALMSTAGAGGPTTGSLGGGGGASWVTNGSTGGGGAGGTKGNIYTLSSIQGRRCIEIGCGAGGGGGGGFNSGGAQGGAGGAGGGALIIEILGNLTLDNSLTVINANGSDGGVGVGTAGGGGGGGGGSVYIMYTGTLTGTCTPTVAGGAGGSGSGNGGAGGAGVQLIEQNVVFS